MTDANWYTTTFKAWQTKLVGSKPATELLSNIHGLGARPGKQAMACAMALRPEGVTNAQIVMVCGAPQLNKMRGFITDGLLKRVPVAPDANHHSVYKLELTAKGTKRIEAAVKRAAEQAAKGEAVEVKKAKRAPGDATAAKAKANDAVKASRKAKRAAKVAEATGAAHAENAPDGAVSAPEGATAEQPTV